MYVRTLNYSFGCLVFLCIIVCLHSIVSIKGSPDSNGSGNSGSGFPLDRGQLVGAHAGCSTRPLIADTECYAECEERSTRSAASGASSSSSHSHESSFRRTQGAAFAIVPDASPASGSGSSSAPTSSSARRRTSTSTRPTPASAAGDERQREGEQEEEEWEQEGGSPLGSPDALTERALDEYASHFLPNSSGSSESFTELNTDEPFRYNCSTRMLFLTSCYVLLCTRISC